MKKRFLSVFLCLWMVVGILPAVMVAAQAATGGHTRDEAVAWARSKIGTADDFDGSYGAQCVDLICFYYRYLGQSNAWGDANAYMSNALPSGWARYTNGQTTPQPGDIVVYDAYAHGALWTGHIGIVVESNSQNYSYIDYNGCGGNGAGYTCPGRRSHDGWASCSGGFGSIRTKSINQFSCVIRPDWPSSQPTAPSQGLLNDNFYARIYNPYSNCYLENRNRNVQTANSNQYDPRQIWLVTHDAAKGSYKFTNQYDGYCLDARDFGTAYGTNIQVHEDNGSDAQRWWLCGPSRQIGAGNDFYFVPRYVGDHSIVMDVQDGDKLTYAGTNIQLFYNHYKDTGTHHIAQTFWIMPVSYTKPAAPAMPQNIQISSSSSATTISWSSVPLVNSFDDREYETSIYDKNAGKYILSGQRTTLVNCSAALPTGSYRVEVRAINTKYAGYASAWQSKDFTVSSSYAVTVSTSPSAGGTVSGGGSYAKGTTVTVKATANSGYIFKGWTEGGSTVSTSPSYIFTVNSNRVLTAVFEKEQGPVLTPIYIITTIASPAEGGTVSDEKSVSAGETYTVTAKSNTGYKFKGWTENGSTVSTSARYTFTVNASRTLTAVFEKGQTSNYTVAASASPSVGGSVTGGGTYQTNAKATVTAKPNMGYKFKGWTENGSTVSTSASYSFTVSENRNLTAVFEPESTIVPTVTVWPKASAVNYGQRLFSSTLSGGTASVSGTFQWVDPSVSPKTGQSYDVTFIPSQAGRYSTVNGKVSVTVNKSTPELSVSAYQSGASVIVNVSASNPYNTALNDVPTPVVTYRIGSGTAQTVTGGSFAIPEGTAYGTVVSVTASTAGNGYYQAAEKSTTLTVTGSNAGAIYHVLTTSGSDLGGAVNIQPDSAKQGQTVTVTATPRRGYTLRTVTAVDVSGAAVRLTNLGGGRYTFTMPDRNVTLDVVFEVTQDSWVNPFSDIVEGAWYYDAVKFVSQNGLMNGSNGIFDHSGNLSRAMIAQILYNKEGRPAVVERQVFSDVTSGVWYTNAVIWAADNKLVLGDEKGLFLPNNSITREQLAVILWRYAGRPTSSGRTQNFADAGRISSYAKEAMGWAVENGIISGKGGGVLDPQGPATRAHVAQMLKNYFEK